MKKNNNINTLKNLFPYLVLICLMVVVLTAFNLKKNKVYDITTGELMQEIANKTVTEILITPSADESIYYVEGKLKSYEEYESFKAKVVDAEIDNIVKYTESNNLDKYETNADKGSSQWWISAIFNILPIFALVIFGYFMLSKMMSGNKNSMDFGRNRAKLSENGGNVKFDDVAGFKEEKKEVGELIDFLKNPKKYQALGAKIPKGVLLVGPPGTGKTLLAKAVAGEANVPFFYISGSDFVELYVGVGASRVRDMFKEAKRNAPCLIFIDEIDAVGRQRGSGIGGGHDEREQTLNQLLTEMDGFGANEGIIIIAATNRPDVLDPALLRPGRFDRQVTVNLPDQNERHQILELHAKNKILAKSINLKNISKRTPGFTGADLANLLNEAALLAARNNQKEITMDDIDEATDRVLMGPAKTSRKITDKEKKLVSIHEAGHAVIGIKLEDADEVHKITIIPRGPAGGYTMMLPKEEKMGILTKSEMLARIIGLLGGRVAEEIFLDEITTGASDDFKRATNLARNMVTQYGMSSLGPVQYEQKDENVFLGRDYNKTRNYSDTVALEIDQEARKIIFECYDKAKEIIKESEDLIFKLSEALIAKETLTKEQIDDIVAGKNEETGDSENTDSDKLKELKTLAKEKKIKGYTKMTIEELEVALKEEN